MTYASFEVPEDFAEKLKQDCDVLWQLVYSPGGEEPEFANSSDREFANTVANDFIDRGESRRNIQHYILQLYGLHTREEITG